MQVTTKIQLIDFIVDEGKRQGYTAKRLGSEVGYAKTFLNSSRSQHSISFAAAVNFLQVLGYKLEIVPDDIEH